MYFSLSLYIYICMYMYIYIYIYVEHYKLQQTLSCAAPGALEARAAEGGAGGLQIISGVQGCGV